MKGLLVRIGIDKATNNGEWNSPAHLESREFVYVPIPEKRPLVGGLERSYVEIMPFLTSFAEKWGKSYHDLRVPGSLHNQNMHLDPDFDYLTYGDVGTRRGSKITKMSKGDVIAFYGSLKPLDSSQSKLVYALIGLYIIEEILWANEIPEHRREENAHTRRRQIRDVDIVVRAKPGVSGRLERCIPIGEWRNGSYRVRNDILEVWGGLSVKDGFIQRGAVPPSFLRTEIFYEWFREQNISLIQKNNRC